MQLIGAIILLIIGGVSCFYGFAVFRILLSIWGLGIGALIGGLIANDMGAIIGGIAGAIIMPFLYFTWIYLIGAVAGFVLILIFASLTGLSGSISIVIVVVFAFVGAVAGGRLAVASQKLFTVLFSALSGAYLMVSSILLLTGDVTDLLLRHSDFLDLIEDPLGIGGMPWWAQLGLVALTVGGIFWQYGGTKGVQQELEKIRAGEQARSAKTAVESGNPGDDGRS